MVVVTMGTSWMKGLSSESIAVLATVLATWTLLQRTFRRGSFQESLHVDYLSNSLVIMPLDRWSTITKKGLAVAVQLKGQLRVVHLETESSDEDFEALWERNVVFPLKSADRAVPELVLLPSRKGRELQPIANYILEAERNQPDRQIIVVLSELGVRHWWQKPLHNNRNRLLRLILSMRGSPRIITINVPWRL